MGKKIAKSSRKQKKKRLEKSQLERQIRKKRKCENACFVAQKPSGIALTLILRKNALPVSVLLCGCLFYFNALSNNVASAQDLQSLRQSINTSVPKTQNTIRKVTDIKISKNYTIKTENTVSIITYAPTIKVLSTNEREIPNDDFIIYLGNSEKIIDKEIPKEINKQDQKTETVITSPIPKQNTPKYIWKDSFVGTDNFSEDVKKIIGNAPMKNMLGDIATRDRSVATFLVAIAMKESKFGTYAPKKEGKDCFNYWGYRGRENTTMSGYSCFDNPAHAIRVVGNRIEALIKQGLDTPSKMIVWKCGSTCAGHSEESVDKWIADVSINFFRLNPIFSVSKITK